MGLLERIATRYARIKVVPIGYLQTELYQNEIVIARPQNDWKEKIMIHETV